MMMAVIVVMVVLMMKMRQVGGLGAGLSWTNTTVALGRPLTNEEPDNRDDQHHDALSIMMMMMRLTLGEN